MNNTKGLTRAFDAKTGKLLWTFHNIPQKGEFGYDSWENNSGGLQRQHRHLGSVTVDKELARLSADRRTHRRLLWRPRARATICSATAVCVDLQPAR